MTGTRRIGSLDVSVAGLGCNNFGARIDEERARAVVHAALDAGVTLFDTADIYGDGRSEEYLGRALGARRADVVITTKVGNGTPDDGLTGGSPAWIARAAERSLERLGTDHIDLYLLHRPDPATPIADTLQAFAKLVADGKVLEVGGSGFSAAQLREASDTARELGVRGFVNLQNELSLLERDAERDVLPLCAERAITFVPYFPLAAGMLTGKYRRGAAPPEGTRLAGMPGDRAAQMLTDARFDLIDRLDGYARAHGHTLPELALSWLAGMPAVASVIAGATAPDQVRANVVATTAWDLTDEQRAEVDRLART
jgi:aryl-alcohol dehydrogenase-like predicted oxidoreductase